MSAVPNTLKGFGVTLRQVFDHGGNHVPPMSPLLRAVPSPPDLRLPPGKARLRRRLAAFIVCTTTRGSR
jgi:hypothetical protein